MILHLVDYKLKHELDSFEACLKLARKRAHMAGLARWQIIRADGVILAQSRQA